ncbi:MAG TPA: biopolymer transporter ExbD [Steroidobacteraceae bacterium]|jgi:biopolymer transport protein ExbD|nr:biopolymer transporter ExbD [Steroidobacteraceae bacterium]
MSMSVGDSDGGDAICDINTTPLIDVMLVLVVMLILTLPVMNHAVKLDMPNPNAPPPPPQQVQPEVVLLEIYSDNTIVWDGMTVDMKTLEGYFQTDAVKDPQPEIHLQPDRRAKYDVVAKVLAAAQRNHMKRIGFVNVAAFSQ